MMMSGSRTIPAPDEHVWWNGLRWVEAAHMQVTRFSEAFDEEVRALTDADMRRRLNDDSDVSRSRRESMDVNYRSFDQQRPLRVPCGACICRSRPNSTCSVWPSATSFAPRRGYPTAPPGDGRRGYA